MTLLLVTIKVFGKGLCGIILLLNDYHHKFDMAIDYIISPELKSLTIGSHSLDHSLSIMDDSLEELCKRCKKLKNLKIVKAYISHYPNEDEIKKKQPNCIVEIKECVFPCEYCNEFPNECTKGLHSIINDLGFDIGTFSM